MDAESSTAVDNGRCRKRQHLEPGPAGKSSLTVPAVEPFAQCPEGRKVSQGGFESSEADAQTAPTEAEAEAATGQPHPRLAHLPVVRVVLDGVLSPELCRELVFVFRSSSTVGYRPHVRSATIHDVVATAPWLLPPVARARHAVLSAVEASFGLSLELAVEFSGLIGWGRGAALGWHHDANREYLSQRHLSAVLYLNTQGEDFGGGDFRFQDGPEPLRVAPRTGRLVAYTADRRNVHCVEEVAWGERCSLTCWFSLDPGAAEDGKVLQQLSCNLAAAAEAPTRPPPAAAAPPPVAAQAVQPDAAERRGKVKLGAAGETAAAGVCSVEPVNAGWWQRCMGPGLPDTMYRLPALAAATTGGEDGGGQGGGKGSGGEEKGERGGEGAGGERGKDLRLERLRELGLYVMRWPGGEDGAGGAGGGDVCTGGSVRFPCAPAGVAAHPREPAATYGSGVGLREARMEAAGQRAPVSAGGELEGDGCAGAGSSEGYAVGLEEPARRGARGGVWVGVVDEREAAGVVHTVGAYLSGRQAAAAGDTSGSGGGGNIAKNGASVVEPSFPPPLLHFPSLSAALLAAQFASLKISAVRFRSVGQLFAVLEQIPEYTGALIDDLHLALPTWLTLGSLSIV